MPRSSRRARRCPRDRRAGRARARAGRGDGLRARRAAGGLVERTRVRRRRRGRRRPIHLDVVAPGNLDEWTHPPFAGVIDGEPRYGRGAQDDKGARRHAGGEDPDRRGHDVPAPAAHHPRHQGGDLVRGPDGLPRRGGAARLRHRARRAVHHARRSRLRRHRLRVRRPHRGQHRRPRCGRVLERR